MLFFSFLSTNLVCSDFSARRHRNVYTLNEEFGRAVMHVSR